METWKGEKEEETNGISGIFLLQEEKENHCNSRKRPLRGL